RRRHTKSKREWSSDVCSSDLGGDRCGGGGDVVEAWSQRDRSDVDRTLRCSRRDVLCDLALHGDRLDQLLCLQRMEQGRDGEDQEIGGASGREGGEDGVCTR